MVTRLKERLWAYIFSHNPELMYSLQETYSVTRYLEEKVSGVLPLAQQLQAEGQPSVVIEERCLNAMTEDLKPSKYIYLRSLLKEEFPTEYRGLKDRGMLMYELLNMLEGCAEIFNDFNFKEDPENSKLRHAMIARVQGFLIK